MKIVTFAHSLASCWNHGNAHFLRGLLRELVRRGHDVVAFERADGWSRHNLVRDHGQSPLARFAALFPELTAVHYTDGADVSAMLDGADLAIVHEWTDPELVREIGAVRKRSGSSCSSSRHPPPRGQRCRGIRVVRPVRLRRRARLRRSLAEVYRRRGWGNRVFVFHEAADVSTFSPPADEGAEVQARPRLDWQLGRRGAQRGAAHLPAAPCPRCGDFARRLRRALSGRGTASARNPWRALPRLGGEHRRAERFRPASGDGARAAPPVYPGAARHPDDPRVRGAGLRHPARLGALARRGRPVPPRPRLPPGLERGGHAPQAECARRRPGPACSARRQRTGADPRAHVRPSCRRAPRHRREPRAAPACEGAA